MPAIVANLNQQRPHENAATRFTREERAPIAYFFLRLSKIYGVEFTRQLPDDAAIVESKREWGDDLKTYDRGQLDKGISFIKKQRTKGGDGWQFLDIPRCIGAIVDANRSLAAHKALPAPEGRQVSNERALSLFSAMRSDVGIDKADPKRIDTTNIEAELKIRPVIDRASRQAEVIGIEK